MQGSADANKQLYFARQVTPEGMLGGSTTIYRSIDLIPLTPFNPLQALPLAIRRDAAEPSDHAKLIGDLYVHGAMDGEGLPVKHGQEDIVQILLN
jgi:hypothetical protein